MESGDLDSQANSAAADEGPGHAEDEVKEASAYSIYHSAPRTHSRTYLAAPNHPFEIFSGCDPNNLHLNIVKTARGALPPPFLHGRFQAVQSLPSSLSESIDPRLTGTIDPRLPPIAREWEYDTRTPGDHASWEKATQEQPRYEPWLDPTLEQQDRAAQPPQVDNQLNAPDEADEYGETQQELAELAARAVAIVRHDPTVPRGRRLRYSHHPQTRRISRAPPIALRRKTTNAEPPSHPPPDTTYSHGTLPIPPEILSLVTQIKSLPRKHKHKKVSGNNSVSGGGGGGGGYPMPTKLRSIPGMNSRNGYISKSSPLMKWYGDTRLFTEKWWKWLYVGGKARRELEGELGEGDEL